MLGFTVRSLTARTAGVVAGATLLAAAGSVAAGTASAAARPASGTGYSVTGSLTGVAATSAGNAWAVGYAGKSSLIVRWNGRAWARQSSPAGTLSAVAASSATNAWAVGSTGAADSALTLHWNGKSWQSVPVPGAAGDSLAAVATTSASNAWAVGSVGTDTLILHWNGKKWSKVATPPVKKSFSKETYILSGVSASSASNVWMVGTFIFPAAGPAGGVTLHWNGKKWSQGPTPAGPQSSVAVPSASDVWTSGCECAGNPGLFDTAHWNGKSWSRPRNPFGGVNNGIDWGEGVVAATPKVAWAAGLYSLSGKSTSFLMRWTGSAWKLTSFAPKNPTFAGVAVTSAGNAWAVGATSAGKTLILHWNGSAWH
jgi:hypothetical protein